MLLTQWCSLASGGIKRQPHMMSIRIPYQLSVFLSPNWASLIAQLVKDSLPRDAGDPSLIPRLGRSTGEVIGYPLKYSWASLVAQLVKNPLAMQETWVLSLGWEDPQKGKVTPFSILAWKIPCGHKDSETTERLALPLSRPNWTPFGIPLEIHKRNRGEERSWSLDLDEWL